MTSSPHHSLPLWHRVLQLGCAVQLMGMAVYVFRRRSPIEGWLFLHANLSELRAVEIDRALAWLGLLSVVLFFEAAAGRRNTTYTAALMGGFAFVWSLIWMRAEWVQDMSMYQGVSPLAWGMRIGGPLAMTLYLLTSYRWKKTASQKVSLMVLRVATAVTFGVHGYEAIMAHPRFMDLIYGTLIRFGVDPVAWFDRTATILTIIGAIDLLTAFLVLWTRSRVVLTWMCVWGTITAMSRITLWGFMGMDLAYLRVMHAVIPLALLYGVYHNRTQSA